MELSKDFSPTTYPIIRIKHGRFLDPVFEAYIKANPRWTAWECPSKEKIKQSIELYKKAWKEKEEIIIKTMCEAMSLNFLQNIIDVYVVCGNDRQFSDPIVIKSSFSPEDFIDVLTHELTHKLMTDSVQCDKNEIKMGKIFKEIFPKQQLAIVRNHILTYSLMHYIFLDVLKDKNWLRKTEEKLINRSFPEYREAWNTVKEIGYMKAIEMAKNKRILLSSKTL
ncbi:MAG: hypothetical protein WCX23_03590 [Candidatus Paceibacterota bacterium]|jgi:hypothetical protein